MMNNRLKVNNFNKAVKKLERINNKSKNSAEAIKQYLEEIGESAGLKYLLDKKIFIEDIQFTWLDTGNLQTLKTTKKG